MTAIVVACFAQGCSSDESYACPAPIGYEDAVYFAKQVDLGSSGLGRDLGQARSLGCSGGGSSETPGPIDITEIQGVGPDVAVAATQDGELRIYVADGVSEEQYCRVLAC